MNAEGTTFFVDFLQKNENLYSESNKHVTSNNALVLITLRPAEPRPVCVVGDFAMYFIHNGVLEDSEKI